MFAISVILCSYNPREEYLRRVLKALEAQTLPTTEWELLLMDNASNQPLSGRFDLSWHPNARIILEPKPGKTHAILQAIAVSKGDILVIVDDDNVLRKDYLQTCLKLSSEWPVLGCWGGSCIGEFEIEPANELRPWLAGLVVEKVSEAVWAKLPTQGKAVPPGAGMAVRRKVALHYREEVMRDPLRQALGRTGKKLAAGEDSDMALCGFKLGLGMGRFPELELTHLISARRLTLEYLEGLYEGFGYSGIILEAIHGKGPWYPYRQQPIAKGLFLRWLILFARGAGRVERRIKLAEIRGQLAAQRDLRHLGYAV
jgi:glycosyltransferase involved in cell wall biosynthesis